MESTETRSGNYTADLLGNIKSHLASLQGYDVMALELLQNADDAKADEVHFDICDDGLYIYNNRAFSYCGDLNGECLWLTNDGYACDFHRITNVGSGGKAVKSENIGRFGIGFVSSYQVTDNPQITSSGLTLTLQPEIASWKYTPSPDTTGTRFLLPWAKNPKSQGRMRLATGHITDKLIEQLALEFQQSIKKSLLFLKHLRKAIVSRNGAMLLSCSIERVGAETVRLIHAPDDYSEDWLLLSGDATEAAEQLYSRSEILLQQNRSPKFTVAIRKTPETLDEGLLYAFLPTAQASGLPLHINGDFFPETDRKEVVFKGNQYQQHWNEMLIHESASLLANNSKFLLEELGDQAFWTLIQRAFRFTSSQLGYPDIYETYWKKLKDKLFNEAIVRTSDGSLELAKFTCITKPGFDSQQKYLLRLLNIRVVDSSLNSYRDVLANLKAQHLSLAILVDKLKNRLDFIPAKERTLEAFYSPLWKIIEGLISANSSKSSASEKIVVTRLQCLSIFLTVNSKPAQLQGCRVLPDTMAIVNFQQGLPGLNLLTPELDEYPNIKALVKELSANDVIAHMESAQQIEFLSSSLKKGRLDILKAVYSALLEFDDSGLSQSDLDRLAQIPLWPSGKEMIKSSEALLPGNYQDPFSQAKLINVDVLNKRTRSFLRNKLNVEEQTLGAFIQKILPRYFDETGPRNAELMPKLFAELQVHSDEILADTASSRSLRDLPLIPTKSGDWSSVSNVLYESEETRELIGGADEIWVDSSYFPQNRQRAFKEFLFELGVPSQPPARLLVDRVLFLTEKHTPSDTGTLSVVERCFYALAELFDSHESRAIVESAISSLEYTPCLPAMHTSENWFEPANLFSPSQYAAFSTQGDVAPVLRFRNWKRMSRNFLETLGLTMEPNTWTVVLHLKECVKENIDPSIETYKILNSRLDELRGNYSSVLEEFRNSASIYVDALNAYIGPSKLFFSNPKLGSLCYQVPKQFVNYSSLLDEFGVREAPESRDFIQVILDISSKGVWLDLSKEYQQIYLYCFQQIRLAVEELSEGELDRLKESQCLVSKVGVFAYPDELLMADSAWHQSFFGDELDTALYDYQPEDVPLLKALGVASLREMCGVEMSQVAGEMAPCTEMQKQFRLHAGTIQRSLYNYPSSLASAVGKAAAAASIFTVEQLKVVATVDICGDAHRSPEVTADTHYLGDANKLYILPNLGRKRWSKLLEVFLHSCLPGSSGESVPQIILGLSKLMDLSASDAAEDQTDAGIKPLSQTELETLEGVTSPNVESEDDESVIPFDDSDSYSTSEVEADEIYPQPNAQQADSAVPHGSTLPPTEYDSNQVADINYSSSPSSSRSSSSSRPSSTQVSEQHTEKTGRSQQKAEHKKARDHQLLSYVRSGSESNSESENGSDKHRQNLAIEAIARDAVCKYELLRGRIPKEMSQTHPGYDIESTDTHTGEIRYIEVKGKSGAWDAAGVGISHTQYQFAARESDRFWLYVVENAGNGHNPIVHPLQSPTSHIDSYMFDKNWKQAVIKEEESPARLCAEGLIIKHMHLGSGVILAVHEKGSDTLLDVLFDGKATTTPNLRYNRYEMELALPENS